MILEEVEKTQLEREIDFSKTQIRNTYKSLVNTLQRVGNHVWRNRGHTPQQVLDGYDTSAAELFNLSAAAVTMLAAVTGETIEIVPAGYEFTVNQDGTVTITAEPQPEPEVEPEPETQPE